MHDWLSTLFGYLWAGFATSLRCSGQWGFFVFHRLFSLRTFTTLNGFQSDSHSISFCYHKSAWIFQWTISKLSLFKTNLSFLINGACLSAKYRLGSKNSFCWKCKNAMVKLMIMHRLCCIATTTLAMKLKFHHIILFYLERVSVLTVFVLNHYHCNHQNQSIADYFLEVDSTILIWVLLEPICHISMLVLISMVVFLFCFSN